VRGANFASNAQVECVVGRECGPGPTPYFTLEAGEHVWRFSFTLPDDCPPSITHPSGDARIVYEVRGGAVDLYIRRPVFSPLSKRRSVSSLL
jgi:hypothetical protein